MTISQLQTTVDDWIKTYGVKYFDVLTNLGILMEETGELSRHLVRKYGEQSYRTKTGEPAPSEAEIKKAIADEMADILWVISCLANQQHINLTAAIEENLKKKTDRDSTRHLENKKLDPGKDEQG